MYTKEGEEVEEEDQKREEKQEKKEKEKEEEEKEERVVRITCLELRTSTLADCDGFCVYGTSENDMIQHWHDRRAERERE